MKDFIEIERVWQDEDFFEMKITCSNLYVLSSIKTYMTDECLDNLSNIIKKFVNGDIDIGFWENVKKNDETTSYVSFKFSHIDSLGHILVEVYLDSLNDNIYEKYSCNFFIKTELGILLDFATSLKQIKEKYLYNKVILDYIDLIPTK
ncbi:hypothetical protein LJB90_03695 [Eubacteriales bacterium OttesenSCG-928-G02]|nr:hypothetical protein [Eubacteriales bacterium OttesenSCG-928-G02]